MNPVSPYRLQGALVLLWNQLRSQKKVITSTLMSPDFAAGAAPTATAPTAPAQGEGLGTEELGAAREDDRGVMLSNQ